MPLAAVWLLVRVAVSQWQNWWYCFMQTCFEMKWFELVVYTDVCLCQACMNSDGCEAVLAQWPQKCSFSRSHDTHMAPKNLHNLPYTIIKKRKGFKMMLLLQKKNELWIFIIRIWSIWSNKICWSQSPVPVNHFYDHLIPCFFSWDSFFVMSPRSHISAVNLVSIMLLLLIEMTDKST